jgi:hypothetical protein
MLAIETSTRSEYCAVREEVKRSDTTTDARTSRLIGCSLEQSNGQRKEPLVHRETSNMSYAEARQKPEGDIEDDVIEYCLDRLSPATRTRFQASHDSPG